jgi:hypothetical protein
LVFAQDNLLQQQSRLLPSGTHYGPLIDVRSQKRTSVLGHKRACNAKPPNLQTSPYPLLPNQTPRRQAEKRPKR